MSNKTSPRRTLYDKPMPKIPRISAIPHQVTVKKPSGETTKVIKTREVRPFLYWWGLELVAWLSATLSTFAIIITFARFDQKPVSSWRFGVTPNALLQVLSQIGQTAVLLPVVESISQLKWLWYRDSHSLDDINAYANAWTSPFANFWLLWQGRQIPLVYLGAVCSWLLLLFGAFAQQALQTPLREVVDGQGSIPRAVMYDAGHYPNMTTTGFTDDGDPITITTMAPPAAMRKAITNGLFGSNVSLSAVAGTCPTGNCTWDPYRSLRIHASVIDVTNSIGTNCSMNRQVLALDCTYSIPEIEERPTWLKSRMIAEQVVWVGASDTTGGYEYTDLTTLGEFYVIYQSNPYLNNWKGPDGPGRFAANLKALKGTLKLGLSTLHTSVQSRITIITESDPITHLDWRRTDGTNGTLIGSTWSYETISATAPGDPELFWIDRNSSTSLKQYLSSVIFTGNGQLDHKDSGSRFRYTTDGARAVGESLYARDFAIYPFGSRQGLEKRLDILAMSMTNGLRTTSVISPEKQKVLAPARRFEPHFDIAWGWLVLPIATVVMTLVLLSSTMFLSARHGIPAWKSGQLASLLALSPEVKDKLGDLRTNDRMEEQLKRSGGMRIRLSGGNGHWSLVADEGPGSKI